MRSFTDEQGAAWDTTIGKASWGTLVLLFVPRAGGEPRSVVLADETSYDAERALDEFTDADLRSRLHQSVSGTSG